MEDYGNRDWELPCICGHMKWHHYTKEPVWNFSSCRTWTGREHCMCQKFKLDNLALVEQVARARRLV
jgi:hypothetical protein